MVLTLLPYNGSLSIVMQWFWLYFHAMVMTLLPYNGSDTCHTGREVLIFIQIFFTFNNLLTVTSGRLVLSDYTRGLVTNRKCMILAPKVWTGLPRAHDSSTRKLNPFPSRVHFINRIIWNERKKTAEDVFVCVRASVRLLCWFSCSDTARISNVLWRQIRWKLIIRQASISFRWRFIGTANKNKRSKET
jgi:hypothetical protein